MKELDVTKTILIAFTVLLLILYLSSNASLNEMRKLNTALNEDILTQKEHYTEQTDQLNASVDTLKNQLEALTSDYNALSKAHDALLVKLPIIDKFELSLIEKKGITDPTLITNDLMNKPELIAHDGVLGGTMKFSQVYLITDQWAFARFDDGHILGSGLYQYKISNDHSITWKLIKSMLY